MDKRFSVLIPTYNRPEYTRQAINSVLSQAFSNYELIVIDDGSTDTTPHLLQSYGSRIKVLHQQNQGPEAARKAGASEATGEYLVFLDSDDLMFPNALKTYDKIIRTFDSPAVILGAMTNFQQGLEMPGHAGQPNEIKVLKYRDFLSKDVGIGISNSKIVIRKSVFKQTDGFLGNTSKAYPFDDYDLMLRAGTHGPCVIVIQPVTVAYRMHETNTVGDIEKMIHGLLALIRAERRGRYPGGWNRLFDRYARIGGPAHEWIRKGFKSHRPGLALQLLVSSGPMVAAAMLKKYWHLFYKTATPSSLPQEE
jgi:glycosyltransferase involved in cell wall biosynthesis